MQTKQNLTLRLLAVIILLAGLGPALAQPTIISTVPSNGATGVAPGAAVVFTFSTAMDSTETAAFFSDVTASYQSPSVVSTWSAGNTVLTCKPAPNFANNHNIQWNVNGPDALGNYLASPSGSFTTVVGVNGGSGTNAVTTFLVGKYDLYQQTSSVAPLFSTHEFFAQTTLSSNRTATNITVTIPVTSGVTNLVHDLLEPEVFDKTVFNANLTNFNTTFPAGNYVFNVRAIASNQQVTVNLPNYAQPNGPQVTNYPAAQAINPAQPFTLGWNTFTNGLSTDWIVLGIDDDDGNLVFQTPFYGQPGALTGTARSVTIPANVLPANWTNTATLIFYRLTATTTGGTVTEALVGSVTYFTVSTGAGSAVAAGPVLAIIRSGANVLVQWPTNATGYILQFSTNLTSLVWNTNLPTPAVINTNKVVTNSISGPQKFFRLIK